MKMSRIAIVFAGLVVFMTSCISDLYDKQSQNSDGSILADVSSSFDWSTITSVDLTVKVADEYNAAYLYTVEVFDKNPLAESDAKLMVKGLANQNQDFQASFSVPQGTTSLFVRQTTPQGLSSVKAVDVAASIELNFATQATAVSKAAESAAFAKSSKVVTRVIATSVYAESIPSDAVAWTNQGGGSGSKYYLNSGTYSSVNLSSGNCDLYISGNVTVNYFYCGQNTNLFLLPGSQVTIVFNGNNVGQSNTIVSVNTDAKLTIPSGVEISNNVKFYNKGTIVTPQNFKVSNSSTLYNEAGTVEISGLLSGENQESVILNYGTILASNFTLAGNSKLTNGGTVTVSGLTNINSTNAVWRNEGGTYTTQNMIVEATNPNSYNGCKLIVNNLLTLSSAKLFTMGASSSLVCKDLYMTNSRVDLGAKALFKVNQSASYSWNPKSSGFGFYGTDETSALLLLKKVENVGSNDIMHYGGNLQIECGEHPSASRDAWNIIYTIDPTVSWYGEAQSTLVIPASDCSEGHLSPSTNEPEDPTFPVLVEPDVTYTYAAEDLWPEYGDYDLNDLVLTLKPSYYLSATNKVTKLIFTSKLKAVGATKALASAIQLDNILSDKIESVSYQADRSNLNGSVFEMASSGSEADQVHAVIPLFDNAHQFLGVSQNVTNTVIDGQTATPQTFTVTITFKESAEISIDDIDISKLNFFMVTDQKKTSRTEVHLRGYQPTDKVNTALFNTGVDAFATKPYSSTDNLVWMILVPEEISYPVEKVSILKAYPSFKAWATSSGEENVLWYTNPDQTYIYK